MKPTFQPNNVSTPLVEFEIDVDLVDAKRTSEPENTENVSSGSSEVETGQNDDVIEDSSTISAILMRPTIQAKQASTPLNDVASLEVVNVKRVSAPENNGQFNAESSDIHGLNSMATRPNCHEGHVSSRLRDKAFRCSECPKTFVRQDSLKRHSVLHQEKPHKCLVCHKAYQTSYQLERHVEAQHKGATYKCKSCDRRYSTKHGLRMHELAHVSSFKHLCPVCGKGFNFKSDYTSHLCQHSGEKPFCCLKCNKKFSRKSHLTEHDTICGKQTRDNKCIQCNKKFKSPRYLKQHVKCTHENPEGL